jgi:UDP-N-acetyl-D-mannosaminuronic acid dehydrogenase
VKIVIVGGAGHVGLPFGLVLANHGLEVTLYDLNGEALHQIASGKLPFIEQDAEELLRKVSRQGNLKISTEKSVISESDVIVLVLGTPVDEFLNPNPEKLVDDFVDLLPYLKDGQKIILRSTVFPGVTKAIKEILNRELLKIHLAYCPERIREGFAIEEIQTLPQLIGATSTDSFEEVKAIFDEIGVETLFVSPEEAELAKLFTNVWRYLKFAIANQFWMISNDLGVDFSNIHRAMIWNYPRASDLPTPGFTAGPCLFKDTMQLSALLAQNFPLGSAAVMINEGLPSYLVKKLNEKYDLQSMTVGILGAAFKADVDDIRGSLSFKLRRLLKFSAKDVLMSDPYVRDSRLVSQDFLLSNSDVVVIATPHSIYRELEITPPVIDIWNISKNGILI